MPGLAGNLSDLTVASPQYDILLCSQTLVFDMLHVSEVLVPGFGRPVLLCRVALSCVGDEDVRASFLFVSDLNGHRQEWLGSTTTNRHGVAAFEFATVSGCDPLVVGPTYARGGILDLMMTDVLDLVRVAGVAPIGNSDHSSLSAVISMAQTVPNFCVSRKVFLKHQINSNTFCGAIRELPRRNIWVSDNPVEVLNEHLSLLVGRYVPTKVIRVHNKETLGSMINACMLLASSRRLIFGGPVIALGLIGKSLSVIK